MGMKNSYRTRYLPANSAVPPVLADFQQAETKEKDFLRRRTGTAVDARRHTGRKNGRRKNGEVKMLRCGWKRGTAPLNLCAIWRGVVNITPRPLYSRGKGAGTVQLKRDGTR